MVLLLGILVFGFGSFFGVFAACLRLDSST
jgi:hypothetical protein